MTERPPQEVHVEKRKHPDEVRATFRATTLGRDRWGEWLLVDEKRSILLLPEHEYWVAWFRHDGSLRVDIAAEVQSDPAGRYFLDIDLDIERGAGGELRLLDEDQFAERSPTYPPAWTDLARRVVSEVIARINRLDGPFDGAAHLPWRTAASLAATVPA